MLRQALASQRRGHLAAAGAVRDAGRLAPARGRPAASGPRRRTFGSPTCSDWVFLRHTDAIKCGPGTSRRSHTPDEYVDLPEVTDGAGVLRRAGAGVSARGDDACPKRRRTLWSPAAAPDRRHVRLHRGRRPAVGRPAAALGRARQPGPRRGSARVAAAHAARSTRGSAPGCAPALAAVERGTGSACLPGRRTCTRRSRTGSPGACPGSGSGCTPAAPATIRSPAISGSFSRTGCSRCTTRRWRWRRRCSLSRREHRDGAAGRGTRTSGERCPRSLGLWAGAYAEGLLDTLEALGVALGAWWTARRWAARPATACRCRSGARRRPARSGFAGLDRNVAHGAGRPGQARGRGALLVHPAGPRARPPGAGRDPVQRRGVRLSRAARASSPPGRASCRTSGTPICSS